MQTRASPRPSSGSSRSCDPARYDPQLDRKVAIKLLFARDAPAVVHVRLVAEAKTMAKLAHLVAMELVRGRTLRSWWSEAPRSVADTLTMCLQAGAGLAAAHAAGIVHCDASGDLAPSTQVMGTAASQGNAVVAHVTGGQAVAPPSIDTTSGRSAAPSIR